jgi:hypothetical protein
MKKIYLFTILLSVFLAIHISAQIPQTMSYQGILTDNNGNMVQDGTYKLKFKLYESADGSTSIWEEEQDVQTKKGVFDVVLGKVNPLNLPFDKPYWLGIAVGNSDELKPRISLASSAYSFSANSIAGIGKVVKNINNITDTVFVRGESGAAVVSRGDTIFISAGQSGGGGIIALQDPAVIPSLDITHPTGPTTNITVANGGILSNHIRFNQVVKTLDGLKENITLVPGENVSILDKNLGGNNQIVISAFKNGGQVGNLVVNGSFKVVVNGDTLTVISNGDIKTKGEIYAESFHQVSKSGDTLTVFDSLGSRHYLPEIYNNSIELRPVNDTTGSGFILENTGSDLSISSGRLVFGKRLSIPSKIGDPFKFFSDINVQGELYTKSIHQIRLKPGSTSDYDTLTSYNSDGTSYHAGNETFGGDVRLRDTSKLIFPDGTIQTTAASDSSKSGWTLVPEENKTVTNHDVDIYGEISAKSFHIVDNGDSLLNFYKDGKSTFKNSVNFWDIIIDHKASNIISGKYNGNPDHASKRLASLSSVKIPLLNGQIPNSPSATPNQPAIVGYTEREDGAAILGQSNNTANTYPATWGVNFGGGPGVVGEVRNSSSNYPAVWALQYGIGTALLVDHQGSSGDIFTGRSGGTNQVRIDKTGKGFFNGGTQSGGADVAEAFEVEKGLVNDYEPGDVLTVSVNNDRCATKSSRAYSTLVIGVYATKPGVLLTERKIDDKNNNTIPVGVIGIIPTKVTTENGPISRGDILVSSSKPGYAMKGTDKDKMFGAVIGKALEDYSNPVPGKIKVLVNVK